jgi:hypothetical protein
VPALKLDNASCGSVNASTLNPLSSKPILRISIMSGSSSTNRMRLLLLFCCEYDVDVILIIHLYYWF